MHFATYANEVDTLHLQTDRNESLLQLRQWDKHPHDQMDMGGHDWIWSDLQSKRMSLK